MHATAEGIVGREDRIPIRSEVDIVEARNRGRDLAREAGFRSTDQTLIATAISEVTRNIIRYAEEGEVILRLTGKGSRPGIVVVAMDSGPGIPDIEQVLEDGYTTGRSLGLGLPGMRRLMDEFQVESEVGEGTTVTMWKWTTR